MSTPPHPTSTLPPSLSLFFSGSGPNCQTDQSRPETDAAATTTSPPPHCGALVLLGGTVAVWAQRDTRPLRSVLQKHALILLAASPPCQVNGWASDSGLYIPTVPSIVKPCSSAAYMIITTPTATTLYTENASD